MSPVLLWIACKGEFGGVGLWGVGVFREVTCGYWLSVSERALMCDKNRNTMKKHLIRYSLLGKITFWQFGRVRLLSKLIAILAINFMQKKLNNVCAPKSILRRLSGKYGRIKECAHRTPHTAHRTPHTAHRTLLSERHFSLMPSAKADKRYVNACQLFPPFPDISANGFYFLSILYSSRVLPGMRPACNQMSVLVQKYCCGP